MNDLNAFLLSDAAPSGKPFTVGELLDRAERIVARQRGGSAGDRVARLVALGSQYKTLEQNAKAHALLAEAYATSRTIDDPAVRADAACAYAVAESTAGHGTQAGMLVATALAELPARPSIPRPPRVRMARQRSRADRRRAGERDRACGSRGCAGAAAAIASPVWDLRVRMTMAEAYRVGTRYPEAIAAFEQANARLQELGGRTPRRRARSTTTGRSRCSRAAGRWRPRPLPHGVAEPALRATATTCRRCCSPITRVRSIASTARRRRPRSRIAPSSVRGARATTSWWASR